MPWCCESSRQVIFKTVLIQTATKILIGIINGYLPLAPSTSRSQNFSSGPVTTMVKPPSTTMTDLTALRLNLFIFLLTLHATSWHFGLKWYIVVFNACPSQQIIIPFSTGRLSIIYFLKRNDTPRPFKSSTQFSELYKFLAILPALKKNRTIR